MAKNKGSRITITLECTNKEARNWINSRRGIFRYTSTKNRRNTPARIELKKFCPKCNSHQLFKEIK